MTAAARTPAGDVLTDLVLEVFRLNGGFFEAAERLARPVGLTAAWWQVLGITLDEPRPVAEIARRVGGGKARQSVQRIADLLVDKGWATYEPNPRHARAKLLAPTPPGRRAVHRLAGAQHRWADAVAGSIGEDALRHCLRTISVVADEVERCADAQDAAAK
ncbi:MAG: MarR family winged helix-turn-helix transcriptional regulator [Mycobacteriales bacterium]